MKARELILEGKNILITGGTGTWGQELAKQCLCSGAKTVKIFSRNEAAQVEMKQRFSSYSPRILFFLGDVKDAKALDMACIGVNIVFHTAALKHVTKCEQQPREAVNTNIVGAKNVINACISNDVDVCVNISSDKVCGSSCVYGHTKALAEALFTEANNMTEHTDFYSVRSGNIFASRGSVIELWKTQVQKDNCVQITDTNMSRFFITVEKAVELTLKSVYIADRGEVFVFRMPSFSVGELADMFIQKFGKQGTKKKFIGKFDGEKDAETLFTGQEAKRMKKTADFFIIYPSMDIITVFPFRAKINKEYIDGFTSDDAKGTRKELEKMFKTIME